MTVIPFAPGGFLGPEESPAPRTIGDHTWRADAACHSNTDPDLFFPDHNGSPEDDARIEKAKNLCARCPVRLVCLDDALDNGERAGIWGGLTEQERRPAHASHHLRLDRRRIEAAWSRRSVHLSRRERAVVVRRAHRHGVTVRELARMVNTTDANAELLLREERKRQRRASKTTARPRPLRGARRGTTGTEAA